ncbi:unnamed protein product [Sphagnum jensenii]|uniref:Uncharacterized protein n=1 Tax=Sphagnum jensenii TaxID=128206 RepID=A0ABP0VH34_9BRYO
MYRQDEQLYQAHIAAYRTTFPTFKTDLLSLEMDETTERGSDDSTHTRHTVQDEATFGPPPTNQATDIKTRKVFSAEVVLIAMVVVVEVRFLEGPSLAASSSQVSGGGISKFRITVVNRNYEDILPDSQGVTIAFQSLINHVLNGIPPIWKTEFHFLPHNALNTQPSDLFCQISMSLRQNTHCNLLNHACFLADPTRANPPSSTTHKTVPGRAILRRDFKTIPYPAKHPEALPRRVLVPSPPPSSCTGTHPVEPLAGAKHSLLVLESRY